MIAGVVLAGILIPALATAYLSTGPSGDRSWFWQNQLPQGNPLRSMSWIGTSDGWAVGVSGTALRTTDGGRTWIAQDPRTTRDLTGVSFATTTTGWAVGLAGTIKMTGDGGATWTTQTAGTASNLRAVSFANSNVGVAVGDTGTSTSTIRYTADGGTTWRVATTTSTVGLSSVQMVSATTGWAVGGAGMLLKTVDGGASWTVRPSPTTAGLAAISFAPGGVVGYFVGNAVLPNWTIYRTADSGATWTAVSGLGATGAINLFDVNTLDANSAIAVGSNGQIRRTNDGGTTWTNQSQNNVGATALRGVKLLDASRGYAIGDAGMMFHTRNGGDSWFTLMQGSLATWLGCSFADVNNGWAVGTNGAIMRTSDAGQTWEHQAAGIGSFRAVHFVDTANGWVAGDGGVIKRTANGVDWQSQASGTTQQLNGLWFTSATTGIAVGNGGTVLKTTNGGATWVAKPSGITQTLNAVWFADANTGFAVGAGGRIRKTTNGGETWATLTSGTGQTLLAVRGISAATVWASGNGALVLKTTNGGTSWTTLGAGAGTNPVRTVFFSDANTGWIASNYGIVQKSTDGGTTWTSQNAGMPTSTLDPPTGIYGAWFADGNAGYLVGDAGTVRRTLDGGANWSSLQYGTLSTLNCVVFPDSANGWAPGNGGTMMRTSDGGQTWVVQKTGSTSALNGVWMTSALSGWAVGDNGTIRRTTDGGLTWTAQTSGVTANLSSIASGDGANAIAAGAGVVKRTSDGGSTWTSASVPPTQPVTGLYMTDSTKAWAVSTRVAGNNVVWHTTDGGATWASQATTANANLWDVYFRDANVGYAVGDSGVILKTVDGGANWIRRGAPTTLPFYWIRFADANMGWAVGGGGVVARTMDGGQTWTLQSSGTNQGLTSTAFSGAGRGWIVGVNGTILRNDDLTPPTTSIAVAPPSPNGTNGWYAGTSPAITLSASHPGATYYGWSSAAAGPFSTYSAPIVALEGTRTLYYYSVDAAGNAEIAKTQGFMTDVTSPTVPTAVTAAVVTTSTATMAWTAGTDSVSGVDHYEIRLDGVYATSSNTTSAPLTGLPPSTLITVTVETVDRAGNRSPRSSPATFLTDAIDTTPYTTVLSVDPLAPNGANDWYVTTPAVTMTSSPANADPRTTYYSWVSAVGPFSAYASTLTPSPGATSLYYWTHDDNSIRFDEPTRFYFFKVDTETPAAPSVTATATSERSIIASWTPVAATPSGIDRYDVYLGGTFYTAVTTGLVDIVGLRPSTAYSVSVRAVNSAGTSSTVSVSANATTPASLLPTAPGAVNARAPAGEFAYVDWTPSDDAVGAVSYRVWRSSDGVTYSAIATTTGGWSGSSYIDTGLRSSTRYWYAVSTVDARGESSLSNTSSASWDYTAPVTQKPRRPLGVTASGASGVILLQWAPSDNPAVVGYYVSRAPASMATATPLFVVPTAATAYFDITANSGEPYYYSVTAVDASGAVSWPSVEVQARAVELLPVSESPHAFGNDSACICHSSHTAAGLDTLIRIPGASAKTMCPACHSPSLSYQEFIDPLLKSKHPQGAAPTPSEPYTCTTCHVPLYPYDSQPANLMKVDISSPCVVVTDTPAGNGFCYKCHGRESTLTAGDMTVFESSGHRNVPAPPTGANITCDTCHESHSSRNAALLKYAGYMVCMQCHTASASDPSQVDIYGRLTLNDGVNTKHPLLPSDQVTGARMACQNCHNTHTTTKDHPLVDPHNPGPAGTWPNPRTDEKSFCFRCHDGQPLPTSVETSPWAEPVLARGAVTTTTDIRSLYTNNVHGFASRSGAATTTAFLRADMGYAYGDVLECRACHDPHGTANANAIREDIVSASGDKTVRGVLTYRVAGGPKDFRFFCGTCHIFSSALHDSRAGTSTVVFPTNCKACHSHATGGVPGGGF